MHRLFYLAVGFLGGALATKLWWPTFQYPTDPQTEEQMRKFIKQYMGFCNRQTNPLGDPHNGPHMP